MRRLYKHFLRVYFSGKALEGLLAADGNPDSANGPRWIGRGTDQSYQRGGGMWTDPLGLANIALGIGDAMVDALDGKKDTE